MKTKSGIGPLLCLSWVEIPLGRWDKLKNFVLCHFFLLFEEIENISREFASFFNKLSLAIEAQQISNTSRRISVKVHLLKSNIQSNIINNSFLDFHCLRTQEASLIPSLVNFPISTISQSHNLAWPYRQKQLSWKLPKHHFGKNKG